MNEETRTCKDCGKSKPIKSFKPTGRGGYRRRVCYPCYRAREDKRNPAYKLERQRRYRANNPVTSILWDCRQSDRKRGFSGNDLDKEFIAEKISEGCLYCGERSIRMTLDRIDNEKPHDKSNVAPCCIRCNYLKGSMPYEAWLHIVPAVREASELGLFGSWRSEPISKKGP